jgi:hypothetical protein
MIVTRRRLLQIAAAALPAVPRIARVSLASQPVRSGQGSQVLRRQAELTGP